MPFATTRLRYFVLRALWAGGEALLITAYTALALDVTPREQRGARASLDNQVGDVALLFLPVLFGLLGSVSHRAAFWLARTMAARGTHLRAGQVILSGALGPMVPVGAGDLITVRIGALGTVSCRLA